MNRFLLSLAALSAITLSTGFAAGEPHPAPSHPQQLVKVASLHGAQVVREFEHNVRVMQRERMEAEQLSNELKNEKNPKERKALQEKFEAALAKLRQDNLTMAKTYGFSLTRNYTMEITDADIYMVVSDAEAKQIEQQEKAARKK